MTMTRCNGTGCIARRDCARAIDPVNEYWVSTAAFQPAAGYQCAGYLPLLPQEAPAWTKRIPEMRR